MATIEGASENRGLGHRFLRHIERCRLLCLILDMAGTDQRDPLKDYQHLLKELEAYDPALLKKPRLVVANKSDEGNYAKNLARFTKKHKGVPVHSLSCLNEEGLPELRAHFWKTIRGDEAKAVKKAAKKKAAEVAAEAVAAAKPIPAPAPVRERRAPRPTPVKANSRKNSKIPSAAALRKLETLAARKAARKAASRPVAKA